VSAELVVRKNASQQTELNSTLGQYNQGGRQLINFDPPTPTQLSKVRSAQKISKH